MAGVVDPAPLDRNLCLDLREQEPEIWGVCEARFGVSVPGVKFTPNSIFEHISLSGPIHEFTFKLVWNDTTDLYGSISKSW
jgi:hypothetical protein